jgi:hypothetical protein
MEYQRTYTEMSNEELLNVAADVGSLEDDARIAIAGELSRRKLFERDIIQYRQDVAAFKPEDFWGKDKPIARSVNGCGTAIYGKRDFEADSSFVTTKWVVVFFIPVWPLKSMRVKKVVKSRWFQWFQRDFQHDSYFVRELEGSCWRQVIFTWAYCLFLYCTARALNISPFTNSIPLSVILVGAAVLLPWTLRKLARARVAQKSK